MHAVLISTLEIFQNLCKKFDIFNEFCHFANEFMYESETFSFCQINQMYSTQETFIRNYDERLFGEKVSTNLYQLFTNYFNTDDVIKKCSTWKHFGRLVNQTENHFYQNLKINTQDFLDIV